MRIQQHRLFEPLLIEPLAAAPADLAAYDHIIVFFSGGKDSIASVLTLFEAGAPRERIELWHHDVDGREGSHLMDWPCTPAYCRAFASAFDLPICFSWKVGGFEGELLRQDAPTAATAFETPAGDVCFVGGHSSKRSTRRRFPQVSADLRVRWCSAYLKIDVAARAICNQPRFLGKQTLVASGERAEESAARAQYCRFAPHRTDPRAQRHPQFSGAARRRRTERHVDHWRPIHGWSAAEVWDALRRWRINPHPCYRLGWGRCSCAGCIFLSDDGWASLRAVNPAQFERLAAYEQEFGHTIRRSESIVVAADRGTPYASITPAAIAAALSPTFDEPIILPPDVAWQLPAGAYGDTAGPT